MSSRIIRSSEATRNFRVAPVGIVGSTGDVHASDNLMNVEKQAFEKGYKEGERIGKQMGERTIESTVKRYEQSIQVLGGLHRTLTDAMEVETVRLSLEIAKKILQREVSVNTDLVAVMVSVALKRVHGHHNIEVRVSTADHKRVVEAIRSSNASIPVKEDSALERGDFIVDSLETHLDGRISSQIDAVGRAMFDE